MSDRKRAFDGNGDSASAVAYKKLKGSVFVTMHAYLTTNHSSLPATL